VRASIEGHANAGGHVNRIYGARSEAVISRRPNGPLISSRRPLREHGLLGEMEAPTRMMTESVAAAFPGSGSVGWNWA